MSDCHGQVTVRPEACEHVKRQSEEGSRKGEGNAEGRACTRTLLSGLRQEDRSQLCCVLAIGLVFALNYDTWIYKKLRGAGGVWCRGLAMDERTVLDCDCEV